MLKQGEIIRLITDYIGVSSGYLGDFSYRKLEEFFPVYCDLEVDPSKFQGDWINSVKVDSKIRSKVNSQKEVFRIV